MENNHASTAAGRWLRGLWMAPPVLLALWAVLAAVLFAQPALTGVRGAWLTLWGLAAAFYGMLALCARRSGNVAVRHRSRPRLPGTAAQVYPAALRLLIVLGLFCLALSRAWGGWIFIVFMAVFLLCVAAAAVWYGLFRLKAPAPAADKK